MRVPHTMWTHQKGQVLTVACHKGVLLLAAVVRWKIRGIGWRGSLLLQTNKHCIQQQRSSWLRCKKATVIQQKKHVVAECVGASWSLCQAGLLLLSIARFVCMSLFGLKRLVYLTLTMTNRRGDVFFALSHLEFHGPYMFPTLEAHRG